MICSFCKTRQKDDAKFCYQCGSPLKKGDLQSGTLVDNRYEILTLVGKGGMGALYKVKDHRLMGSICALKEMLDNFNDPDERAEGIAWFRREAEILCKEVRHPNIPVVIDFFIEKGRYYLVMDFIEGKNLESLQLPMDEETIIPYALTALEILEYLHSKKIIHRDIKPENFLIQKDTGKLFLVDFGTARTLTSKSKKTAIGTQGYASPEHYEGTQDERSDLYSLGATIHRLITNMDPKDKAPFRFAPVRSLNPRIGEGLANIVEKSLKYKREERWQSASEMKKALEELNLSRKKKDEASRVTQAQQKAAPAQVAQPPQKAAPAQVAQPPKKATTQSMTQIEQAAPWTPFFSSASVFLKAHHGHLYSLAFSPGGRFVVTGGEDSVARLWDLSTGKEIIFWAEHTLDVKAAAFSPDGRLISTGSDDTSVKIREGLPGSAAVTLTGHSAKVSSLLFSPGGSILASGDENGRLILWDTKSWKSLVTLEEHGAPITGIAFSPTGKILASASGDGAVILWDTKSRQKTGYRNFSPGTVRSISFYPVNNYLYLACGMGDGAILIWDIKGDSVLPDLRGHKGSILALSFSKDGKLLASGGEERIARLWRKGKCLAATEDLGGNILALSFSPSGEILAAGTGNGSLHLMKVLDLIQKAAAKKVETPRTQPLPTFSAEEPQPDAAKAIPDTKLCPTEPRERTTRSPLIDVPLFTVNGFHEGAQCACFTSDSKKIVAGSGEGSIKVIETSSGKASGIVKKIEKSMWSSMSNWFFGKPEAHAESISAVILTRDDENLITASCDAHLKLWRYPVRRTEKQIFACEHELFCAALSPDGHMLAAGSKEEILLFCLQNGEVKKETPLSTGEGIWVNSVAFSPDGHALISGDDSGAVCLWALSSRKLLKTLKEHAGKVYSVSFSPDGKCIASASLDSTVRVVALEYPPSRLILKDPPGEGNQCAVLSIKFSPDGRFLAAGGEDGATRLWDYKGGNLLYLLKGHKDRINDIVFSPNGRLIATCSEDETMRLWEVP